MDKIERILLITISCVCLVGGFAFGNGYTVANTKPVIASPQVIEVVKTVTVEVPVEKIVTVEKVVEKIVEVDKPFTVNVYNQLREFESLQVLAEWVNKNCTMVFITNKLGNVDLTGNLAGRGHFDCDDYAKRFQALAARDGYLMSTHLVKFGKINDITVTSISGAHMGNFVIIGNDGYYIEPQDRSIIKVCELD
jgi:hypothetical protein